MQGQPAASVALVVEEDEGRGVHAVGDAAAMVHLDAQDAGDAGFIEGRPKPSLGATMGQVAHPQNMWVQKLPFPRHD